MKKCINQQMSISLNDNFISEPIGKIHRNVNTYRMIDDKKYDWGLVDLCDDCKNEHIKNGWTCLIIKK